MSEEITDKKRKTKHYIKNITVHLDRDIVVQMVKYPEVNWSVVCRESLRHYLKERERNP